MAEQEPVLRVVRGAPTEAELAAALTVLLMRADATARATPGTFAAESRWVRAARPGAMVGCLPAHRGPGAWRGSALPR